MVLIRPQEGDDNLCNGTLIGRRHVLTARHCVDGKADPSDLKSPLEFSPQRAYLNWYGRAASIVPDIGASTYDEPTFTCDTLLYDGGIKDVVVLQCSAMADGQWPGDVVGFSRISSGCGVPSLHVPAYMIHYQSRGLSQLTLNETLSDVSFLMSPGVVIGTNFVNEIGGVRYLITNDFKSGSSGSGMYLDLGTTDLLFAVASDHFWDDPSIKASNQHLCKEEFESKHYNRAAPLTELGCHYDPDGDGVVDWADNCPSKKNPNQRDFDEDGLGDVCDEDDDNDGVPDDKDPCPQNPEQSPCCVDTDLDGVADCKDNCPSISNPAPKGHPQADRDSDGIGDACDLCPDFPSFDNKDFDGDGIGDVCDNCPETPNEQQEDRFGGPDGDACDPVLAIVPTTPTAKRRLVNMMGGEIVVASGSDGISYRTFGMEPPGMSHMAQQFYCARSGDEEMDAHYCDRTHPGQDGQDSITKRGWYPVEWRGCARHAGYGKKGEYRCPEVYPGLALGQTEEYCGDRNALFSNVGPLAEIEWLWRCEDTEFGPAQSVETRLFALKLIPTYFADSTNSTIQRDLINGEATFANRRMSDLPILDFGSVAWQLARSQWIAPCDPFERFVAIDERGRPVEYAVEDYGLPTQSVSSDFELPKFGGEGSAFGAVNTSAGIKRLWVAPDFETQQLNILLGSEQNEGVMYAPWTQPVMEGPSIGKYADAARPAGGTDGHSGPQGCCGESSELRPLRSLDGIFAWRKGAIFEKVSLTTADVDWAIDASVSDACLAANGSTAFLVDSGNQALLVVDGRSGAISTSHPLPEVFAKGVATIVCDATGESAMIWSPGTARLGLVSALTGLRWITPFESARPIDLVPAGFGLAGSLFVGLDGTVSEISKTDGSVIRSSIGLIEGELECPGSNVAVPANTAWVATSHGGRVEVFAPGDFFRIYSQAIGFCPAELAASADGRLLAVAGSAGEVAVIDIQTGAKLIDEVVAGGPVRTAFEPSGDALLIIEHKSEIAMRLSGLSVFSDLPPARANYSAMPIDASGEVMVFGGSDSFGVATGELWAYNAFTSRWRRVRAGGVPQPREAATVAASTRGATLLMGGSRNGNPLLDLQWFDAEKQTFSRIGGNVLPPVLRPAVAVSPVARVMYLFGGLESDSQVSDAFWRVDLRTGEAHTIPCVEVCPNPAHGASLSFDEGTGELLLRGGVGKDGPVVGGYIYSPALSEWRPLVQE